MPAQVDSNSPAFWAGKELNLLNSTGNGPMLSQGADQFQLGAAHAVGLTRINPWPTWMEAVWVDPSGPIFGWYHQEHFGVCNGKSLSVPQIGAAVSYDGGASFRDLGTVISSGDAIDCSSQNGYFAGGQGDVSVILDRDKNYFYFLFTNYAGPLETQGVSIARMPFSSRYGQTGAVWKYYNGAWNEPGIHGRTTPIFPAKVSWQRADTNSFWGPSVHWNTYLDSFVVLLNHACCSTGFPQEGIYASFSTDLSDPKSWSKPKQILESTGWYPQILGTGPRGTDTQAGQSARLYVGGYSYWEIQFEKAPTDPPDAAQPVPPAPIH